MLRVGAVAVGVPLAGCVGGRQKHTSLDISIRTPFDSDSPIAVPLTLNVYVSNVSKDVALRGVDLVLCDEAREPIASRRLGDFAWREAPPERREVDESDSLFESTWYSANWTLEPAVEVDGVPEWITFTVDEVWFGDSDEESDGMVVGEARASSPIPEFEASIRRFDGERPAPPTVSAEDFRSATVTIRNGVGDDVPLLPDPTPTPSPSSTSDNGSVRNGTVTEQPPEETSTYTGATNESTATVGNETRVETVDTTPGGDD